MNVIAKLGILADAAKYDVACTSSGAQRGARQGSLGTTMSAGCCHSFTPDGRCISLFKVLLTNVCIYDCAYCVNRSSNDTKRVAFTPRELADLTIGMYRRNYIEGLFLSSGVIKSPDFTTELMIETLKILREEHGFRGYIHAKAIPGTSPELIARLGVLSDRLSVNMELPSSESLALLAPDKSKYNVFSPMKQIQANIAEDRDTRSLMRAGGASLRQVRTTRRTRAFAPAGQSTQMIIGATPESDYHILNLTSTLYERVALKRVFYSAYLPVNQDKRLPSTGAIQLDREHRLYQADWLMRFYHFDVDEIITSDEPFLDTQVDPKVSWALRNLDRFPIEVNTANRATLLRIPGIGPVGARKIMTARKTCVLREEELRKLGIAFKRARYFITCNGRWQGRGTPFDPTSLHGILADRIDGGSSGRRSAKVTPGQMQLFEPETMDLPLQTTATDPRTVKKMGA